MALTVVQDTKNTNGLAQTFANTYSVTPTEGNLLAAFLWHDETVADIATLTSSGWTRMATAVTTLGGFDYRLHIYAKFAGAAESTTVGWDLGEVNRRTHGYAVEYSSSGVTELNAEDAATKVTGDNGGAAATSNQVDEAIIIAGGQIALAICGTTNTSATAPSWASEITTNENWSNNFKASGIGYADGGAGSIQPTATWGSNRTNFHMVVALGLPPTTSKLKAGSTFRALKVA
jgi:hypothetical protein